MSLNEGTNFTLTTSVHYRAWSEGANEKVQAIMNRALAELRSVPGTGSDLKITDEYEETMRCWARNDFLAEVLTREQQAAFYKI